MDQVFVIPFIWGMMTWGTHHETYTKKNYVLIVFTFGWKKKGFNDFRWINVGIAFGDGGINFYNTHIFKPRHTLMGPLGEGKQYNCMQILQYIFYLRLLCKYYIIRTMEVMKLLLILLWPQFRCSLLTYENIIWFYG